MKKILAIIPLCLCLLSNTFPALAQNEDQNSIDISQTGYAQDIELAINLGLTDGYEAVYDVYSEITRAEFVVLCYNLLNQDGFTPREQVFKDVDAYMAEYGAITQMYTLGYIVGDGNGYFHPQDPIAARDAARIILGIAGYNRIGNDYGAADAMRRQGENELLTGVALKDGYLTNGNAIKMLVNALDIHIVEISMNGGNANLAVNHEETILSAFLKIKKIRGQLTATQYANIAGGSETPEGRIIFAGETLRSYDYDDFLGYYGTCYYRENEWDQDERDVLYIDPDNNKNNSQTVQAGDIISYSPYTFQYYKNEGKSRAKLSLSKDTLFLYNDALVESFTDEILMIENGYINFIDSDGDGNYDLVKIYEYENIVADSISDDVIYSKYGQNQNININDYEKIYIYNESGKRITPEAIGIDSVISVYKSHDAKYTDKRIKLVVSSQTVTGTVGKVYTDEGDTYVTIDGTEYKLYGNYQSTPQKDIETGDKGTYLLDANRLIVSVLSVVNDKFKPAYLIKIKNYSEDASEYDIRVKALCSDSGYETLTVSDKKVVIDGITYKSGAYKDVYDKLKAAAPGVAMIKTAAGGAITAIDTLSSNVSTLPNGKKQYKLDDCLFRGNAISGARYKSETMIFEGKCSIDDGTVVFAIPADVENAEENEFMVYNSKYFANDTSYDLTPYYLDTSKVSADIVVIQGANASVGFNSKIGVVTQIHDCYNEKEDTAAQAYTVNIFGAEETWMTKDEQVASEIYKITLGSATSDDTIEPLEEKHTIQKGDIVKCSFDENGNVSKIVLIYDAAAKKMISVNPSVGDFHSPGYRYAMGTVERKSGKTVELKLSDGALEYHAVGNKPIMLLNTEERQTISAGVFADIRIGDELISINRGGNTVCSYIIR